MASGLRLVAQVSEAGESKVISITTREYPAMISPQSGRRQGGGYEPFNPEDAAAMAELQRQAASSLRGWLSRYRGACESAGLDTSGIEGFAEALDGVKDDAATA